MPGNVGGLVGNGRVGVKVELASRVAVGIDVSVANGSAVTTAVPVVERVAVTKGPLGSVRMAARVP